MARRISNRSYPPKECKNPACDIVFTPHDRRQGYCEPQCRINASNDRRHSGNQSRFFHEKFARRNSKILEFFWERMKYEKTKIITRTKLEFESFDFAAPYTETINRVNGREILWYYGYGLEQINNNRVFILRKENLG